MENNIKTGVSDLMIAYKNEEISDALQKLLDLQTKDGFFTEQSMTLLFGPKMSSFLEKYTKVVFPLKAGMSHRVLVDEARKKSYGNVDIFEGLYGMDEKLSLINKVLKSEIGARVLLWGAPSTGKSLIMERLSRIKDRTILHITAGEASTPKGIIAAIRNTYNQTGSSKFIVVLDELANLYFKGAMDPFAKFKPLLNIFDSPETARLTENKGTPDGEGKSTDIKLPYMKTFVATNFIDKIDPILLRRFQPKIPFPELNAEEFFDTAMQMLIKGKHRPKDLAYKMAKYYSEHGDVEEMRNLRVIDDMGDKFTSVADFENFIEWTSKESTLVKRQMKKYE